MPRKLLFPLVVLLAAAAVAGLLALNRTVNLGQPANASSGSDPAISFTLKQRLKRLDRFESSLRKQLADAKAPAAPAPQTIFRRAPSPVSQSAASHGEHEYEGEGRDD
jgi:hypothetical protein